LGSQVRIADGHAAEFVPLARTLFKEYASWLGEDDLRFQGFQAELATLPGQYAPPSGALLVAWFDEQPAGCVALRPLEPRICEMKRLWVSEPFRRLGLGERLVRNIVTRAKRAGYERMRLDTLGHMQRARALYAAAGFREIHAYYASPLRDFIYLEKRLD
jgi:ribosomal protein S18 acetylase RimI-like enzyme